VIFKSASRKKEEVWKEKEVRWESLVEIKVGWRGF
jgi:hypothetical protein